MSNNVFRPIIDAATNLNTCFQLTTGAATANQAIGGSEVMVKALTDTAYIRFGDSNVTVSSTNGYYMAIGDELRVQLTRGASHIAYIQGGGAGALSVMPGNAE